MAVNQLYRHRKGSVPGGATPERQGECAHPKSTVVLLSNVTVQVHEKRVGVIQEPLCKHTRANRKRVKNTGLGRRFTVLKRPRGWWRNFTCSLCDSSCTSAHTAFRTSVKVQQFGRTCYVVQLVNIRYLTRYNNQNLHFRLDISYFLPPLHLYAC